MAQGSYAIAYLDKDGTGFGEHTPWILDGAGGDLEKCKEDAESLARQGFRKVTLFQFGKRQREEYSWKYVLQRKIGEILNDVT